MADSWEGLLDILDLTQGVRERAHLNILMEFPRGNPKNQLLLVLFESINRLYWQDNYTTLAWFTQSPYNTSLFYLNTRIVRKEDIKFIQDLWLRLSGNYILFLPQSFDKNKVGKGDEEAQIGMILSQFGQLLLKTPDGNEILHLFLK